MKYIIAGSRNFNNYELLKTTCSKISDITEVVSGGANGADKLGERYADENKIPKKIFPAEWDKYGKRAGFIRNSEMGDYGDALIAFWDGVSPGTKHMIDIANNNGLKVIVVKF